MHGLIWFVDLKTCSPTVSISRNKINGSKSPSDQNRRRNRGERDWDCLALRSCGLGWIDTVWGRKTGPGGSGATGLPFLTCVLQLGHVADFWGRCTVLFTGHKWRLSPRTNLNVFHVTLGSTLTKNTKLRRHPAMGVDSKRHDFTLESQDGK